jgi:branched-chain amino acid transport system substrate-binding protein
MGVVAASGLTAADAILPKKSFAVDTNQPIKWGFLDTLSGPFGVFGKGNIGGTKLAIKKINESGGIMGRRVEMIIEDDEANTEVSARKCRKLILSDKVDVVQGAASTSCSAVMMKVCGAYKTLHLDCEFDSHTILAAQDDYTFNTAQLSDENERARVIGISMKYKPSEIERWFIFYPDYSYGHDMRDTITAELKKRLPSSQVVGSVGHPMGETDFSNYIVSILEKKPQVFMSLDWAGDATNFIKQAIPFGFFDKVPIITLSTATSSTIVALGKDLPKGISAITDQSNPAFPHMEAWSKEFNDYIGEWPIEESAACYYDGVYMYKTAVEKAQSTKAEDVIKQLEGMEWHGVSGYRKLRKDHFPDVEYVPLTTFVPSDKFAWFVPGETIKVPYQEAKLSLDEMIGLGCEWCKKLK